MDKYDHKKIENKWQTFWEKKKIFQASTASTKNSAPTKKFYSLIEFPYPSGEGLHVGHIRSNTAMDIISHKRRREGYNVMYPIGWDSFGLPTENYAIKTGIHPSVVTKKNTDTFRRQLKSLGFSFDWSREIDTSDPKYYKWTQWIFLQFLKHDLAYKKKISVNWCPDDLTGLANEEVIDGRCERCGALVEKREKEQWMLAITKYADRLDRDLDDVDFLPQIKTQQRNWIGRSEGAEIEFSLDTEEKPSVKKIKIFTTRPDTLFGVTYVVLAPEHLLVKEFLPTIQNKEEVEKYIANVKKETDIERTDAGKEKTGVELKGIKAVNPANNEKVSVWIADYVLADYGTGAVMAVPAHDERDFDFAKKYDLPIRQVVAPYFENLTDLIPRKDKETVTRLNIHAIIRNPKNNKYLLEKWKEHTWQSFVTGGIESGENIIEAGKREVLEETGYKNLIHAKRPTDGWEVHSYFYAPHKDINRHMIAKAVYFDLVDEEKIEVNDEEKNKYDLVWLNENEVRDFLSYENQRVIWDFCKSSKAFVGHGRLINSQKFDNRTSDEVGKEIAESVGGKWVTKYKLRDWVFSRQRYWGEPIPVVHCDKCGIVPVPEKDLPVKLPNVKKYKPTETGESPLADVTNWVNTKCPKCRGKARRETDTMPNWAGSSWYYLRYADPKNSRQFAAADKLKYWTPVDWYNGGMEHVTLHLLYSRFWHKFLFDIGVVPTHEPYTKRTSHGFILAKGGEKMSKSKGNVINPDSIVDAVGADALRLYEMFMGPFDQAIVWDENGIVGCRRFIERVWKLQEKIVSKAIATKLIATKATNEKTNVALDTIIQKTIKKVSEDIELMHFNTAVSTLMIAVNALEKETQNNQSDQTSGSVSLEHYEIILSLLAPFAPHVSEEIWQRINKKGTKKTASTSISTSNSASIHCMPWPTFDPQKIKESIITIPIQINGKTRATIQASPDISEEEIKNMALSLDEIKKWMIENNQQKQIKKVVYVKGRLLNIVLEVH